MDASEELLSMAQRCALQAKHKTSQLKAELEQVEAQKREVEAKYRHVNKAAQRLLDYQPRIGNEYYCPRCWVDRGERRALDASVPSPQNYTVLHCDRCGDHKIPSGRGR